MADGDRNGSREPSSPCPHEERKRAEGETAYIEESIDDEDVEYIESEDEIKYIPGNENGDQTASSGDPNYETRAFDEWAKSKSSALAAEKLYNVIQDRIRSDISGVVIGSSGYGSGELSVNLVYHYSRSGDLISEPNVEYSLLLNNSPQTVDVTITVEQKNYNIKFPVSINCQIRENQ
jgi:hypothetical protein